MDKSVQDKDAVTQKILETTRETERLKQELEALIASGIRGRTPATLAQKPPPESTNKVQIIKSYDPKHSQHPKRPPEPATSTKNEPQTVSPKKPKTYNVEEAREYIKKQRGKRIDEVKNKKSYTQIAAEVRKEKLQELQQKANEIVKKNVEAKRARSKSREPPIVRSRSGNFEYKQVLRSHAQSSDIETSKESIIAGKINKRSALTWDQKLEVYGKHKSRRGPNKAVSMSNLNSVGAVMSTIGDGVKDIPESSKRNRNLLYPPEPVYGVQQERNQDSTSIHPEPIATTRNPNLLIPNEPVYGFSKSPVEPFDRHLESSVATSIARQSQSNAIVKKPIKTLNPLQTLKTDHQSELSEPVKKTEMAESLSQTALSKHTLKPDKCLLLSNITLRKPMDSIKPMAEKLSTKQTPDWLKEQPEPDPYNFINTVKRQLNYVVNEQKPGSVDVGVQGNLEDLTSPPLSGRTDLKSFISHKCLNLDPKTIEHIELTRNKRFYASKDGATVMKASSCSENDSDTSKNIPSISSESCSSLRRNAEFIRGVSDLRSLEDGPPNLDVGRVENVQLNHPEASGQLSVPRRESVEKIKKQLFKSSDQYSSDFFDTDLSRSRDSIISFNRASVSPNRVPVIVPPPQSSTSDDHGRNSASLAGDNSSQLKGIETTQSSKSKTRISGKQEQTFGSLLSTLHPSSIAGEPQTIRSEKITSRKAESLGNSSSSEILTSKAASSGIGKDDGIIELLSKRFTTESQESGFLRFESASQSHKSISSSTPVSDGEGIAEPSTNREPFAASKGTEELYKSKSEKFVLNKPVLSSTRGLSKSEANICRSGKNYAEEPKLSLNIKKSSRKGTDDSRAALMRNITIRSGDNSRGDLNNTNEIHLKFEAEIHLLTDFNKSIRRFSEIEKAFESLRVQNHNPATPIKTALRDRNTQTSRGSGQEEATNRPEVNSDRVVLDLTQQSVDVDSVLTTVNFEDSLLDNGSNKTSSIMQFSRSILDDSLGGRCPDFVDENFVFKSVVGMSLKMFDQMIKDEDARIENWKKVIKIREQALLDRTKGELVWLEMQKKQLIQTGNLAEASLLKKKQRGILLKHQQEKHEMQRLKQMQKEDSRNRKTQLKQERNEIRKQLSSDAMLSMPRPASHRERRDRRLSGPFKVIQASGTTTVRSETSLSKRTDQEIKSITTRTSHSRSMVNIVSETSDIFNTDPESLDLALSNKASVSSEAISNMKQKLLMRERALAKRRKTVEELLQWHKKLLDEEKAIEDLEGKVGTIIAKIPSESHEVSNSVATTAETGLSMPKLAVQNLRNIPTEEIHSEDSNRIASSANYSADFDPQDSDEQSSVSSISQLIEDFTKIEDNILSLMPKRKEAQDEVPSEISLEPNSNQCPIQATDEGTEASKAAITVEPPSEELPAETSLEILEISRESEHTEVPDDKTNTGIHSVVDLANSSREISESIVKTSEPVIRTSEAIVIEDSAVDVEDDSVIEISDTDSESSLGESSVKDEEEPSPIKEDISTTKQCEEIEDRTSINHLEQQPSTSLQDTAAASFASEVSGGDSSSELELPSVIEEERQSFENKTDEEKAASLSSRPSGSGRGLIEKPSRSDIEEIPSSSVEEEMRSPIEEKVATEPEGSATTITPEVAAASDASLDDDDSIKTVEEASDGPSSSPSQTKSPEDIKKHVQDILNGSNQVSRGDKSPRMQDLCLITYDTESPESGSPMDERKPFSLGSEAEELHRKQLAIEQEIKLLKEQQQKEAATPFYVREIPNKPPPPYTPPSKAKSPKTPSVIPASREEVEKITEYSAKIIHKAYMSSNLDNISISDNTLNLIAKNIDKGCFKYVFDVCKEIAKDHYSQFTQEAGPSWLRVDKRVALAPARPLDVDGLKNLMSRKLLELFAFDKPKTKNENAIMKWYGKKRDHVDEVLVQEMQVEETTWTSFDKDEALVKDRMTNEIMEMLLKEAAQMMKKALERKNELEPPN